MKETRLAAVLSLLWLQPPDAYASYAEPSDSTAVTLQEIEVKASRPASRMMADGSESLAAEGILTRARVLGEADFITNLKLLPGVSSIGDYGSGVIVDGADPSQTLYRLDGVPVVFPYRFGGIFSTFNPYHFPTARFERFAHDGAFPSRLGADVDMSAYTGTDHIKATLNLGLIASSAGLRLPLGDKADLAISGRISYLNLLYGSLLKMQDTGIGYDFADANLTFNYRPTLTDRLSINLFHNNDRLSITDDNYAMDTGMAWRNSVASISWSHAGPNSWKATAFYSGFSNRFRLEMPAIYLHIPSSLRSAGANFICRLPAPSSGRIEADAGADATFYHITPQYGEFSTLSGGNTPNRQNAFEARPFADLSWHVTRTVDIKAGLSLPVYTSRRRGQRASTICAPDPRATLTWRFLRNTLRLHAGHYTQFLHQTGFSEMGLASNFWTAADRGLPPQKSWSFSLEWSRPVLRSLFTVQASAYYRIVRGQPEYRGDILEVVNDSYDAFARITGADGFNAGANISLRRDFGKLTGMAGYSYGVARRHFATPEGEEEEWFDATTSPGHSLDANISLTLGTHWVVGARFVYASGRVYTPVEHTYILAGNIARQYAPYNSRRLPDYQRLDLSANYTFRTSGRLPLRHDLNISMLNAYGHKNVEMVVYSYRLETQNLKPRRSLSLYRFLPSISYSITIE